MNFLLESYLIISLIILISIAFVLSLMAIFFFVYSRNAKAALIIPFSYEPELKRIRINDVFTLSSLKFVVKNNNLLDGLWTNQTDFLALFEKDSQKIFLESLENWKENTIEIKFKKRWFLNNRFQVCFQSEPQFGFVLIEIQRNFLEISKIRKFFKNHFVEKLTHDPEKPCFLASFYFPFKINKDFSKNFFLWYNKKFFFLRMISDFSILNFENILIIQISAKSVRKLEKIKNHYKLNTKNYKIGNFLYWLIVNFDKKIDYDWKSEIYKFFDQIIAEKTNFLEVNTSGKYFEIINQKAQNLPFYFNINDYKMRQIYEFDSKNPVYQVYNFDFFESKKIEKLMEFFNQTQQVDHSNRIYKINYVIAQKLKNLPIDFAKFTFLIEDEINIPAEEIDHIENIFYKKVVDSQLFYYLDICKPKILFVSVQEDTIGGNDIEDIIMISLGNYARKEKIKVVFDHKIIKKFNFSNKNFPLYYW
ncbi:hypothetical protein [Mycoplasma sp. 'Moose RK']|uniref:hypothetical protein n=1 Tax=Mycoplasma sp. 'Moose RK' TaxID=2780095 RepID=UPI0018C23F51|nr:hypothetical protein [Mycoplasma sp. 'Moose RK']MBG0730877.1 hypothetical protein [Mycoplasma sp. 'Moose RK']